MISYNGFNNNFLTFKTNTEIQANKPVKIVSDDAVEVCKNGEVICGVTATCSDDAVSVQLNGYVELPCNDSNITLGYTELCADSDGGVKKGTGRQVLVLKIDKTEKICGFIL